MSQRLDEFKEYVKKHPLLKNDVESGKKTWQELYEEFVILGEEPIVAKENNEKKAKDKTQTEDIVKQVLGYIKKIDPDQVTKTVNSIQKIIELFSTIGGASSASVLAKKSTGDPLFDRRFDEWY